MNAAVRAVLSPVAVIDRISKAAAFLGDATISFAGLRGT